MQEVGAIRQDINTRAVAFIPDALTPSILAALSSHRNTPLDDSHRPDQPSFDELVETVGDLCDRLLTPEVGANLEAAAVAARTLVFKRQK
jgi:hypothetical protein